MINGPHLFRNTKAELFVKQVKTRKIIISRLKKQKRPICYMPFMNTKILSFLSNRFRF